MSCQFQNISAVDKNFTAATSSRKPIDPFRVVSHTPDFGSLAMSVGNKERITKGNARAVLNTSIPTTGLINAPAPDAFAARTNKLPTIGAVHVNAETTKVRPIPSMPRVEPREDPLSCCSLEGKRISVTSRSANPKITNSTVNTRLTHGLIAKLRAAPPPAMTERTIPNPVKHVMMPVAYSNAYRRTLGAGTPGFSFFDANFVKKARVTGISGNTHGVRRVTNPARNAVSKKAPQLSFVVVVTTLRIGSPTVRIGVIGGAI